MAPATPSTLAKNLRDLCARPGEVTAEDVQQRISAWHEEHGTSPSEFVNVGNQNGKTPLHFAAQLRNDPLAAMLVEMQADVNVRTVRGHTPLIYACGRANDAVVTMLLANGARMKVRTANGDTAYEMASTRLDAPLLEELAKRQEEEAEEWIDLSLDEAAIAAQADHVQSKAHCATWEGDISPAVREELEKRKSRAAEQDDTDILSEQLAAEVASLSQEDGVALSVALVRQCKNLQRKQAHIVIRKALLKASDLCEDKLPFLFNLLRTQRDSILELPSKLQELGYSPKRSKEAKVLLTSSILAASRELLHGIIGSVPLGDLVGAAPAWMVPELLNPPTRVKLEEDVEYLESVLRSLCHPNAWGSDFGSMLRWLQALGNMNPESSNGRPFQRLVRAYVSCLQAACVAGHALRRTMKDPGVLLADVEKLLGPDDVLPDDLRARLLGRPSTVPRRGSDEDDAADDRDLAFPVLQWPATATCTWVDTDELWQKLLSERLGGTNIVAIDTEWWDTGSGPALVQLAIGDGLDAADCFLVDTSRGPPQLCASLLSWLRSPDHEIVGWSFQEDRKRLMELDVWLQKVFASQEVEEDSVDVSHLTTSKVCASSSSTLLVTDLQPICSKVMKSSRQPSLSSACSHLMGQRLDKAEQCSDWRRRPLTESQRTYAALDAAVLLAMHRELQRRGAL